MRNRWRPARPPGAAVAASLKRFGWQQAIVTDPKGVIVAGETRYKAAVLIGLTAAPVVTIQARQARAFRVIDNRTSELTSWDTDLLPDALSGLNDLDIFSFDDVLPSTATAGKTDPDDIPETPKNPVTRKGDLWVLGKHRIVCGDSTDQKTVECMQRAIHNHKGDVYDPFVGSGTTVIAGEQEGRRVFVLEIEPAYVDVSVTRWEDFTGQKATRKR